MPADVALFDTFAGRRHTLNRAAEMVRDGNAHHVVLYTWDAAPEFVRAARDVGVSGVVLKTRSADLLVDSIERIVAGEAVGFDESSPNGSPARVVELSDRESEVLALIARGLTNAEIADELYLSVETVKTYVKRLYAKLDVHNRAQAAVAASSQQLIPPNCLIVPVRGTRAPRSWAQTDCSCRSLGSRSMSRSSCAAGAPW